MAYIFLVLIFIFLCKIFESLIIILSLEETLNALSFCGKEAFACSLASPKIALTVVWDTLTCPAPVHRGV